MHGRKGFAVFFSVVFFSGVASAKRERAGSVLGRETWLWWLWGQAVQLGHGGKGGERGRQSCQVQPEPHAVGPGGHAKAYAGRTRAEVTSGVFKKRFIWK